MNHKRKASFLASTLFCALGAVLSACSASPEPSDADARNDSPYDEGETVSLVFDFSSGEAHGFQSVFRDVPVDIYETYRERKSRDELGAVAPLDRPVFEFEEDASHWLMNEGIHPLPEPLAGTGYLTQGMNHSDDMDMWIVKELGPEDGLVANTPYTLHFTELALAGDKPEPGDGAGVGGGPVVLLEGNATTVDPTSYSPERLPQGNVDELDFVRFSEGVLDLSDGFIDLGDNSVCAFPDLVGNLPAGTTECPADGNVAFDLKEYDYSAECPEGELCGALPAGEITSDDEGRFWLMVGGHSGFEGFTALFYTRLGVVLTPVVESE